MVIWQKNCIPHSEEHTAGLVQLLCKSYSSFSRITTIQLLTTLISHWESTYG